MGIFIEQDVCQCGVLGITHYNYYYNCFFWLQLSCLINENLVL